MRVLAKEKSKVLAQRNGWSPAYAEGYVEGERYRRLGLDQSTYLRVGIDEYCLGFRAGYYDRMYPDSRPQSPRLPLAR